MLATTLLSLPLVAGFFGEAAPGIRFPGAFPRPSRGPARAHGASAAAGRLAPAARSAGDRIRRRRDPYRHRPSSLPGLGPVQAAFQPKDSAQRGLPAAADQSTLRQSRARAGAVADRPGAARRRDAQRSVGNVGRKARPAVERLPATGSSAPGQPRRRRGDPVAAGRLPRARTANASMAGPSPPPRSISAARSSRSARCICIGPGRSTSPGRSTTCTPLLAAMAETAILAGDLNATPWSAASARIADAGGLTPVGPLGPTWLYRAAAGVPALRRPADRPGLRQGRRRRALGAHARSVGSDHLPVLVEFSLKAAETGYGRAADGDCRAGHHRSRAEDAQRRDQRLDQPFDVAAFAMLRASNLICRAS